MATVEERLEKATVKLENLRAQKKKLDEAIKKAEEDVRKYKNIINRAKYDKLTDSLQIRGLSLDDVIHALSDGDIGLLQEKMESKKTSVD